MGTGGVVKIIGRKVRQVADDSKGPGEVRDETAAILYQTCDGDPNSLGRQLADLLTGCTIHDGLLLDRPLERQANGAGDLAVQLVSKLKRCSNEAYDDIYGTMKAQGVLPCEHLPGRDGDGTYSGTLYLVPRSEGLGAAFEYRIVVTETDSFGDLHIEAFDLGGEGTTDGPFFVGKPTEYLDFLADVLSRANPEDETPAPVGQDVVAQPSVLA